MQAQTVLDVQPHQRFLPHQEAVLRVLIYFSIFDHPLTLEEIHRFLAVADLTRENVAELLNSEALVHLVISRGRYYFLRTQTDHCITERVAKERRARARLDTAHRMGKLIGRFPFVRGVMLSGELSKGLASEDSDIDFVIVTEKRRLWICRSILILFKKIILLNNRKNFCLNYFVSIDHLSAEARNLYSATEIATLLPLHNPEIYEAYIDANRWIHEFFPHWETRDSHREKNPKTHSLMQTVSEMLVPSRIGDGLEKWLLGRWRRLWGRRYPHLSERERMHRFHCDDSLSTAYGADFQQKVLSQYAHRLQRYGLPHLSIIR